MYFQQTPNLVHNPGKWAGFAGSRVSWRADIDVRPHGAVWERDRSQLLRSSELEHPLYRVHQFTFEACVRRSIYL